MNTLGKECRAGWASARGYESSFNPLQLVGADEIQAILAAVRRGELPADFQSKLGRLRFGDLRQSAIEQHCRLFFEMLLACHGGDFHDLTVEQFELVARVLAYVRKENDVIPDYLPLGFTDDHQEVRAASSELSTVLQGFKAWRLKNQVPSLWVRCRA